MPIAAYGIGPGRRNKLYLITNGQIITENRILNGYDLLVNNEGTIEEIVPKGKTGAKKEVEIIDARGGYVSPGFIDIHSDYIEHMAAPRPNCLMDFTLSIRETEKELAGHGITTMFHSLSLYKFSEFTHKPVRDPDNVKKFIDIIYNAANNSHLIRHRFHARFEIDNFDEIDNLKNYIRDKKVHLVSFMDHTPGQGQYRDLKIYKDTVKSYKNLSDDKIEFIIQTHRSKQKLTEEGMREIAEMAAANNIAVASHDDDSIEKLDLMESFGTTISEFPITIEVAKAARRKGMYTVAGAPNVLLGGSHSGNLAVAEAITEGCIDALSSDYYPPSLLHAVFELNRKYGLDLADMFRLVTINPARAVNMDREIGSIKEGKKGDIIIIEKIKHDFPVITNVFVDGRLIQKTNYI